nr:hypothetical protein CFP56_44344 [Quercus suber]
MPNVFTDARWPKRAGQSIVCRNSEKHEYVILQLVHRRGGLNMLRLARMAARTGRAVLARKVAAMDCR